MLHWSTHFFRRLAPYLTDVVAQAVFHITRLVKTSLHQLLDPLLRGRPQDRGKAHIPLRCDFEIRRQTGHSSAKRLVSAIARLSNDAMRFARDSTNGSRSESGNDRLTYPYRSARSPGMSSAPRSTSSARPRP